MPSIAVLGSSRTMRLRGRAIAVFAGTLLALSMAGGASASVAAITVTDGPTPDPVVQGGTASYDLRVRRSADQLSDIWTLHRFAVTGVSGAAGLSVASSPCLALPILIPRMFNDVVIQTSAATPGGTHTITLTVTEYESTSSCSGSVRDTGTVTATLVVVAPQTITFDPLPDRTYGDSFALTGTASSGLPVSYGTTGPCSESGGTLTATGLGSCSVTASQAGDAIWLPADPVTQTFNITAATLTATASDATKVQGDPNPAFSATITGFVLGEDETVLTATPTCDTTATDSSPLGTYPISCSGAAADNYSFSYVDGTLTVVPGALDHIVISPDPASIAAGTTQAYTAESFDLNDNSIGDVTAATVFTIDGAGSCAGADCGATIAGGYTVTGTYGALTDSAALTVSAGAPDHVVITPDGASIVLGATQTYAAELFDGSGNSLGDVTGTTTFSTDGSGSCTGADCGSGTAGDYTVTATTTVPGVGSFTATATLHVTELPATPPPTSTDGNAPDGSSLPPEVLLTALALCALTLLMLSRQLRPARL
jgi:hypothetical protein